MKFYNAYINQYLKLFNKAHVLLHRDVAASARGDQHPVIAQPRKELVGAESYGFRVVADEHASSLTNTISKLDLWRGDSYS